MSPLALGLAIYAVLSLFSMATMSIGAVILGVLLVDDLRKSTSPRAEIRSALAHPVIYQYAIASILIILACILSLVVGILSPLEFYGKTPSIHLFFDSAKLWYFFWPIVLVLAFQRVSLEERLNVFKAWLYTFILLSFIGIFQFYTGWPRPQQIPELAGRFHATLFLGHHLSVASILIFPFFVLLDFLYEGLKNHRPLLPLPLMFAGVATGFITLMLTFSRTLWVALPVGLAIWFLSIIPSARRKTAMIGLCVAIVLTGLIASQMPAVRNRVTTSLGVQTRKDLWEANYEMFKARPLTGVGLKHNQELSGYYLMDKYHTGDVFSGHAHNNILDLLGGTGIIGLAAGVFWFALIFIWVIHPSVRVDFNSNGRYFIGRGLFCALVVFQLNGLTQVNFWDAKVQHQLMFVVGWILWGAVTA